MGLFGIILLILIVSLLFGKGFGGILPIFCQLMFLIMVMNQP